MSLSSSSIFDLQTAALAILPAAKALGESPMRDDILGHFLRSLMSWWKTSRA